jgi:hypothetical protein
MGLKKKTRVKPVTKGLDPTPVLEHHVNPPARSPEIELNSQNTSRDLGICIFSMDCLDRVNQGQEVDRPQFNPIIPGILTGIFLDRPVFRLGIREKAGCMVEVWRVMLRHHLGL